VFAHGIEKDEDVHFMSVTRPFAHQIPDDYKLMPLESFVWAVTNFPDAIPEDDIIRGANSIQRRKAMERWKTDEGRALLNLSPGEEFESPGRRFQMPQQLTHLLTGLIPQILRDGWVLQDATIVRYSEGDSQVPHFDNCDATILVCLSECQSGGVTNFPLTDCSVENKVGNGILFFSSSRNDTRDRNILSLHHGGKVRQGEKIVAQLMLDIKDPYIIKKGSSWLDAVCCL